jgi:hypothetical protein
VYTKWLIPGEIILPVRKRDCENDLISTSYCITIPVDRLLVNASQEFQPFTDNNSRLCGAMLHYQLKSAWILLPCEQKFLYPLFICETTREVATHVEKTRNVSSGFYVPSYHWWNYVNYPRWNYLDYYQASQQYVSLSDDIYDVYETFWKTPGQKHIEYDLYPTYDEGSISHHYHSAQIALSLANTYCYHNELFLSDLCVQLIVPGYIDEYLPCFSEYSYFAQNSNYFAVLQNMTLYLNKWLPSSTDFVQVPEIIVAEYAQCNVYKLERSLMSEDLKLDLWAKSVRCDASTHLVCIMPTKTQTQGCAAGTYECADGTCISDAYRCDQDVDCADGSDEKGCDSICSHRDQAMCNIKCLFPECRCEPLYFHCQSQECISINKVSKLI